MSGGGIPWVFESRGPPALAGGTLAPKIFQARFSGRQTRDGPSIGPLSPAEAGLDHWNRPASPRLKPVGYGSQLVCSGSAATGSARPELWLTPNMRFVSRRFSG